MCLPHGLKDMCMISLGLWALNGYGCRVVDILIGSVCNIGRCMVRSQAILFFTFFCSFFVIYIFLFCFPSFFAEVNAKVMHE